MGSVTVSLEYIQMFLFLCCKGCHMVYHFFIYSKQGAAIFICNPLDGLEKSILFTLWGLEIRCYFN